MKRQGMTPRHQRLQAYLEKVIKLKSEQVRFGDTHGRVKGTIVEEDQYLQDPNAPEPEFNFHDKSSKSIIRNEHVMHLNIEGFGGDINKLMLQLIYWMYTEKQTLEMDYTIEWNNNETININIFFDIDDKITKSKDDTSTC